MADSKKTIASLDIEYIARPLAGTKEAHHQASKTQRGRKLREMRIHKSNSPNFVVALSLFLRDFASWWLFPAPVASERSSRRLGSGIESHYKLCRLFDIPTYRLIPTGHHTMTNISTESPTTRRLLTNRLTAVCVTALCLAAVAAAPSAAEKSRESLSRERGVRDAQE